MRKLVVEAPKPLKSAEVEAGARHRVEVREKTVVVEFEEELVLREGGKLTIKFYTA